MQLTPACVSIRGGVHVYCHWPRIQDVGLTYATETKIVQPQKAMSMLLVCFRQGNLKAPRLGAYVDAIGVWKHKVMPHTKNLWDISEK